MTTTKNVWRALGLANVDKQNVENAVKAIGFGWESSIHVTATAELAKLFRNNGLISISVIELDDIIRWAGMPAARRIPVEDYPSFSKYLEIEDQESSRKAWQLALTNWRQNAMQKAHRLGIDMDFEIRDHLRRHAADQEASRILLGMSTELRQAIVFLINAGFQPDDFKKSDPPLRVALSAWRTLEERLPECTNTRRDLWERYSDITSPSDAEGLDLQQRVKLTLHHLSGSDSEKVSIVYHGFYFYTPPQWALFRLFRQLPNVDQLFVVHDDGVSRAFETWRRYFVERWNMPRVQYSGSSSKNQRVQALSDALEGRKVDDAALLGRLRIVRCRNTTEFVREWTEEINRARAGGDPSPKLVAASAQEINRILARMAGEVDSVVNLANLPIGQFLLALHECYDTATGKVPDRILSANSLINIVASGFLDREQDKLLPSYCVAAFKRALPYFSDLRLIHDWQQRALTLERLVVSEVALLGRRLDDQSDVDRIATAVANELRLTPWCDLTDEEAWVIRESIDRIAVLVDEIVSEGMGKPKNYLEWVRRSLERAMVNLTKEERAELEKRLHNAEGTPEYDLDLEGITEIVSMILGRRVDFNLDGSPIADEDNDDPNRVMDIRFADVYGFESPKGNVHVANLADTVFPSTNSTYMWPFSENSLRADQGEPMAVELLRTRKENGSLEGLYVFWSVLAGVAEDRTLTMSWVAESSDSLHNPSVLLSLLARVKDKRDGGPLESILGGLEIGPATGTNVSNPIYAPVPVNLSVASNDELAIAESRVDRVAAGAAFMCQRRFAIQWALGKSASFQSPHTQSILFGNVQGALIRRGRFGDLEPRDRQNRIYALTRDIWRHLTIGQRKSSNARARVRVQGWTAKWPWVYTLGGKKDGLTRKDSAYRAAFGDIRIPARLLSGDNGEIALPDPDSEVTKATCDMCPVASRCSKRRFE